MARVTCRTVRPCSLGLELLYCSLCRPGRVRRVCVRGWTIATMPQRILLGLELCDEHALKFAVVKER